MNTTFPQIMPKLRIKRGLMFGMLIVGALLAFEIFNYSTTEFALSDLLGDLRFASIRWATILAIAFCGIDFAGIARLFTPEQGADEPMEVWYLFGAWILAATMNAALTWWGVSIAILNHSIGNEVLGRETLIKVVPVFVAVMVWLIRILIIGTFSVAGDRLFSQSDRRTHRSSVSRQPSVRPLNLPRVTPQVSAATFRPAPKTTSEPPQSNFFRPEPTYHPMSMSGSGPNKNQQQMRR